MSIQDVFNEVEGAARFALVKAKAVFICPRHESVTVRYFDEDAERQAYAIATSIAKADGTYWMRPEIMEAIKDELLSAADGECPACSRDFNS